MARKDGSTLRGRQKPGERARGGRKKVSDLTPAGQARYMGQKAVDRHARSWAAIGADTSMTSVAVVAIGYDAILDKIVGPKYADMRWMPEDDYFKRLGQAAKGYDLILDVLGGLVIPTHRVYIAAEEPFFYGAVKRQQSGWLKQQAEVAGAFKGGLARYGYLNIYEINNSQWHAALRKDGVEFEIAPKGSPEIDKKLARERNKFLVKTWAIKAFGLPDLPDLVASKSGAKIPRPESGYGAKAKAVQPNDIYDAAACCAWMQNEIESGAVL
jgi:hypothetical protein